MSRPGLGRLFGSLLYEALVVFSVLLLGFWIPQTLLYAAGLRLTGPALILHTEAVLILYFLWFWLNGGQTLPMRTWRLRLVGVDQPQLRPAQALLRYLAASASLLLGGIGFIWVFFDRDRCFLHDRIAGTRIVWID